MSLEDSPPLYFLMSFIVNNKMVDMLTLQGGSGTRAIYCSILKLCVVIALARWVGFINIISK